MSPGKQSKKLCLVQLVREFVGYASIWWAQALYRVLVLLSLGLVWVLGVYNVRAKLWMLRQCPLGQADFVCVQVCRDGVHTNGCLAPFCKDLCLLAVPQRTKETCSGAQTASICQP